MDRPRFFISPAAVKTGIFQLNEKESRHALQVLRLKKGDGLELFDGEGNSFSGCVIGETHGRLSVRVEEPQKIEEPDFFATLGISVIKPERMEWLVEKSCELGASAIQPLFSQRSVIKLSRERWQNKISRWRKIALETCKQCGRSRVPAVEEPLDFKNYARGFKNFDLALIPTLAVPRHPPLGLVLRKHSTAKRVLGLIGPEGDFTREEVKMAIGGGAEPVSLGKRVLRSETAAVYLMSVFNFAFSS